MTFEEWKESLNVKMPDEEEQKAMKELHGLDMEEQINISLRKMYEDEIKGEDNMT